MSSEASVSNLSTIFPVLCVSESHIIFLIMAFNGNLLSALIEKLMGADNYGTWRHQGKNLLMFNDLWSYVDETIVRDLIDAKL